MRARSKLALLLLGLLGCETPGAQNDVSPAPSSKGDVHATTPPADPQANVEQLTDEVRALARAPQKSAPEQLGRYLFAHPQQRLWASLSMGAKCDVESQGAWSTQLVQATSMWFAEATPPDQALLKTAAWAMGACAERNAEGLMRGWLSGEALAITQDLGRAAALGLATWVDRRGQLSERTQTALLEAAEQTKDAQLLVPLSRLGRLSDAVGAHLLEVAGRFFTDAQGSARRHAILALGSAGESAAEPLGQVLLGNHYSVQERTAAVQALARLGEVGQKQLDHAVTQLLSRGLPSAATEPRWIPLISALDALKAPDHVRGELSKLSNLVLPSADRPAARAERRRLVWLKCRAADLLYRPNTSSAALSQCDPDRGRAYWLALLSALSRQPIEGSQLTQFNAAFDQTDVVVRQAALRLLVTHREIPGKKPRLLAALLGPDPGSVTLAAQLIHTYPDSIQEPKIDNTAEVSDALAQVLGKDELPEEARAAALRAAGALGALNLKSLIEQACSGKNALLWAPAQDSLRMLGQGQAVCPSTASPKTTSPPAQSSPAPKAPQQAVVVLQIESDVGALELHLDPSLAPKAVAHLLAQVDAGFYNHQRIIFGRPGLSVQFGDRDEDGYDNVPAPALPFEISPLPFEEGSVGMSSFAPGAENTQLFVTVSDAPQLFGSRILLGRAKGPWELLVLGDELQSVRRLTK